MPLSASLRGMGKKKAVAAPAPVPAPKPINQRGAEYQAEKLTGNRAVQGKLPTGGPRYVYGRITRSASPTSREWHDSTWAARLHRRRSSASSQW